MTENEASTFVSYARGDSEFALRLARDLGAAGVAVWLDQLELGPGYWDRAVQEALDRSERVLVVLSPAAVSSDNVLDEISFALTAGKQVIPLIHRACDIPLRLTRLQHFDFRTDYPRGLDALLRVLGVARAGVAVEPPGRSESSELGPRRTREGSGRGGQWIKTVLASAVLAVVASLALAGLWDRVVNGTWFLFLFVASFLLIKILGLFRRRPDAGETRARS